MKYIQILLKIDQDAPKDDVAREAIAMAGRLNCPVYFIYRGNAVTVGVSDTVCDVTKRMGGFDREV